MKASRRGWQRAAQRLPRLGLASFRRRLWFRGVFLLLMLATVALALALLKDEKQRSYDLYRRGMQRTLAELVARLRHPQGQLALLNAPYAPYAGRSPDTQAGGADVGGQGLSPLVLPYGALDFDDQYKAQQAVELSGCAVQYANGASLCVAVGNNPYSGGFIYLVGAFDSGPLVGRERGGLELTGVHRARVHLEVQGQSTRWVAPFEAMLDASPRVRGRLAGFVETGETKTTQDVLDREARPVRDFRAWVWQNVACVNTPDDVPDCLHRTFVSMRLPVDAFREALFQKPRPEWPPRYLAQVRVHLQMWAPNSSTPVFDSDAAGASAPLSLQELAQSLQAGETLRIQRSVGATGATDVAVLRSDTAALSDTLPWLTELVHRLPVERDGPTWSEAATVSTAVGDFVVTLRGDPRSVDRALGAVAARMSWFVGGMLAAMGVAWLLIEWGLIRRITLLTRRAAVVSHQLHSAAPGQGVAAMDWSDLRGKDELGILAGGLADLLQRVKEDLHREQLRAQRERDTWHAVGHEIMSPLQSLMVLHGGADDPSYRYVHRMQQAVRVLYGSASPSEAFEAAALDVDVLDVNAFLQQVAGNAHFAGIGQVQFAPHAQPVMARADAFSLEDVVTHVLNNAQRHRTPGTPITVVLRVEESAVVIDIHNVGSSIAPELLDSLFEYGVSGAGAFEGHRGQGLFVVKTYLAKMGGAVAVRNVRDGVVFSLRLLKA